MQLEMRNGSLVSYIVPENLRVSFSDKEMTVSSPRLKASFATSMVKGYRFLRQDSTDVGINQITNNDIRITYVNRDEVLISGIPATQPLRVYATNGTEQNAVITRTAEGAKLSLSSLPNGVLLITMPNSELPAVKIIH